MKTFIQLDKLPRIVSLNPATTSDGEVRPEKDNEDRHIFSRLGAVVIDISGMQTMQLLPAGTEKKTMGAELYDDNTLELRGLPEDLDGWLLVAEYGVSPDLPAIGFEMSDDKFGLN